MYSHHYIRFRTQYMKWLDKICIWLKMHMTCNTHIHDNSAICAMFAIQRSLLRMSCTCFLTTTTKRSDAECIERPWELQRACCADVNIRHHDSKQKGNVRRHMRTPSLSFIRRCSALTVHNSIYTHMCVTTVRQEHAIDLSHARHVKSLWRASSFWPLLQIHWLFVIVVLCEYPDDRWREYRKDSKN